MQLQYHLPLPQEISGHFPGDIPFNKQGHGGLLWTRFFNGYCSDFSSTLKIPEKKENKIVTVKAQNGKADFVNKFNTSIPLTANLQQYVTRHTDMIKALGGRVETFQTQGRFATGMGNEHPTENGFTWHHTLGVPYLPASSVKGLVRGWLEWQWGEAAIATKSAAESTKRQQLLNWFGSEHKAPPECKQDSQAGWFIFFDALPTRKVTLAADVMTPHYDKWYEKGGEDTPHADDTVPADWHSPVPLTFLTVKDTRLIFGVAVRPSLTSSDKEQAQQKLSEVMLALTQALDYLGAGAKTAVGYGRMAPLSQTPSHHIDAP